MSGAGKSTSANALADRLRSSGHRVEVLLQPPLEGERCPSVVRIESVMGMKPKAIATRHLYAHK